MMHTEKPINNVVTIRQFGNKDGYDSYICWMHRHASSVMFLAEVHFGFRVFQNNTHFYAVTRSILIGYGLVYHSSDTIFLHFPNSGLRLLFAIYSLTFWFTSNPRTSIKKAKKKKKNANGFDLLWNMATRSA